MEIIGHVDHVVDEGSDLGDRERLEVPVGGRKGNRHGLAAGAELLSHEGQEIDVVGSVSS